MAGLQYPTLDLFYYYIKEGLGITSEKTKHFDEYWANLQAENNSKTNPIEFDIPDAHGDFSSILMRQNFGDSNCFYLDCSQDILIPHDSPKLITRLKDKLKLPKLPKDNNLCLGYTWIISGWLDDEDDLNQSLAKGLYKELVGAEWRHTREGKFLGARVIEAWRSYLEWEAPELGSHVLIIFYPDEKAFARASDESMIKIWMSLLFYRHKIWYSYEQSRHNKEKIRNNFNQIIPHLERHNQYTLEELRESLETNQRTLTTYSIDLNAIGIHEHSLNTNLDNYNAVIKQFISTANDGCLINKFWTNDLKFLEEFGRIAKVKYKRQLEKDYATLTPGLAVLTGLTETIRGLIEVRQAEIDRQQNITIAIVGLGLSASSAAVGISATQVYQPGDNQRISWQEGLGYSLAPAIVIGISLILVGTKDWCTKFQKLKQAKSTKLISSEKD